MAIFYYMDFGVIHGSRNFGDDINPLLLGKLFHPTLIQSPKKCLIGIGTIINDKNVAKIAHYERKIVFSSGVGYGTVENQFDDSWDFVCVRGPDSADVLGLSVEKGICDGAILLADFHQPKPSGAREGTVFIPHVNSGWSSGRGLKSICADLGLTYLSPDAPFDTFIDTVQTASLVITEAMHGAILADAMRTPWIPVNFLHHHRFKWEDWFKSIEVPYASHLIQPTFWDANKPDFKDIIKTPYRLLKQDFAKKSLRRIMHEAPALLSSDSVIEMRKQALRDRVAYINKKYKD